MGDDTLRQKSYETGKAALRLRENETGRDWEISRFGYWKTCNLGDWEIKRLAG